MPTFRSARVAVAPFVVLLAACGGEQKSETPAVATPAPEAAPAAAEAPAAAPAGAVTAAPITGTTHEVKMIGDQKSYRFEPADITVAPGDGIRFVLVSGGPHNVAFDPAKVPAAAKAQLNANIPEKLGELSSAMKINAKESITISFGNVPAGTYEFFCTPHLAMGMKGKITVK